MRQRLRLRVSSGIPKENHNCIVVAYDRHDKTVYNIPIQRTSITDVFVYPRIAGIWRFKTRPML